MPDRARFPRAARLTRRSEYDAVFRSGKKIAGRYFICYLVRNDGQGCKIGLVVSRKVGGAVVRNRIKRQLREFFRTHQDAIDGPVAMVFIARPGAAQLRGPECVDALGTLLKRGGVLEWPGS